jgi:hypothetical protein
MLTARSLIRKNLNAIERKLCISLNEVLCSGFKILKGAYITEISEHDNVLIGIIHELCNNKIDGFSSAEINDFIDFICTF